MLANARGTILGALSHQALPFEYLVSQLHPQRDLGHTALFQTVISLQMTVVRTPFQGLDVEPIDIDNRTSTFDLTVVAELYPAGLKLSAQYSTDLFEADTAGRLLGYLETLLAGAVADPGQRLSRLPLLADGQRRQLLAEWNRTGTGYPHDRCIHELFEEQARRQPEATALAMAGGETVSYRELQRRAEELAGRLRRRGVRSESLVAVLLDRGPQLVVALLAVLKAGGAFVPLDPENPPQRLAYQLADSGALLLVSTTGRAAGLELPAGTRPLLLDQPDNGGGKPAIAQPGPGNLAYLIYTSGSTGAPKGVLLEHRGLTNLVSAKIRDFGVRPGSRVLQFAALGFDALVSEVFVPLAAGATLCLAERERLLPGPPLAQLLREQQITMVTLPPSALAVLDPDTLPALKTVLSAGERCTAEIVTRWAPGRRLFNGYGPTEATIGATLERCDAAPAAAPAIGRPIANKEVFVLDERLEPVPVGVAGELYIGGVGLARGYHHQPALTAGRFLPHPHTTRPGARLYRTGDRARYRADGRLEFLGRVDNQLKIRGYRIEPAEIETALRQHPSVGDALVTTYHDHLTAYLTPHDPQSPPNPHQLRSYLQQQLPAYMLPSHYHTLDRLPLTPNGKLDRARLPAPAPARAQARTPPRTPLERQLAAIWATTLGCPPIGIHDNFFELGGDSILSVQIAARASEEGLPLTPRMVFEQQTVAEQAAALADAPTVSAEQGPIVGPSPLLPSQRWFFEQEFADPHHWNQAVLLELRRRLDVAVLRETARLLLERHDGLRARFFRTGDGWKQSLMEPDDGALVEVVDLSHVPLGGQPTAIQTAASEIQASLDLTHGPLLKLVLFDLSEEQAGYLLIVAHHLIIDGISWLILQQDIERAYLQLESGEQPTMPRKTTSVREWAERLHAAAQSPEVRAQLPHWRDLAAKRVPELPADPPNATEGRPGRDSLLLRLPPEASDLLLAVGATRGRHDEGLLAAVGLAFARWIGERSLLVEVEGHGRRALGAYADASRTVGWLTISYPVLLEFESLDAASALASARAISALEDGGASYGLLRYLADEPVLRMWPGAQVGFNYLGAFDQVRASQLVAGWTTHGIGPLQSPRTRTPHPIDITAFTALGCLEIEVSWNTAAYGQTTAQRLVGALRDATAEITGHIGATSAERASDDFPLAHLDSRQLEQLALTLDRNDTYASRSIEPREADQ